MLLLYIPHKRTKIKLVYDIRRPYITYRYGRIKQPTPNPLR